MHYHEQDAEACQMLHVPLRGEAALVADCTLKSRIGMDSCREIADERENLTNYDHVLDLTLAKSCQLYQVAGQEGSRKATGNRRDC